MNFANVSSISIPEGNVTKIADASGAVLWEQAGESGDYTFSESLDIPARATLDTGIACKSTDYLYIDFAPLAASIYGAVIHAGSNKIMRFYIDGAKLQAKVDWYTQTIATIASGTRYQVHLAAQKAFLNGTQSVDMSAVSGFTADTNVIIGGIGAKMRLYGVKHGTSAGALDLDMVPAVRNSDGAAGLYDKVSGMFYAYG